MIAQEHNHPKRTWLVVSLLLHGFVIVGLLSSLLEKRLTNHSFFETSLQKERHSASVIAADEKAEIDEHRILKKHIPLPSNQSTPPKPEEKAFTVPAPVV